MFCQNKSDQIVLSPCERHVRGIFRTPYLNAHFSDASHPEGGSCKNDSLAGVFYEARPLRVVCVNGCG